MEFTSDGERRVYSILKQDKDCSDFTVLPSLFISRHLKQISGEIDMLVLIPGQGIFCLEIKHGGVERTSDGKWRFTNRSGQVTEKSKGPFQQVDATMHSLRKLIGQLTEDKPELKNRFSKLMFGTGVMFTSLDIFNNLGTEGEPWQVFLRQDFRNIKSYFNRLSKGWHNKYQNTPNSYWYNNDESRPNAKDCELLKHTLRGDFAYDYSLLNRLNDDESTIDELTKEQFDVLDFASDNPRNLVEGAAGTGKTILALELARRKSEEGKKVALLCYNKKLGDEIKVKIAKLNPSFNEKGFAGNIDNYLLVNTNLPVPNDNNSEFWKKSLPNQFVLDFLEIEDDKKFDYLIIDEAQDVLTEPNMDVIDCLLLGGLKSGNWTFIGDFSNQAIFITNPAECIDLLTSKANYTKFKLKYNCRNPIVVAKLNTNVTGCDLMKSRDGMPNGEPISLKFTKSLLEATDAIENIVKDIENKTIPLKKVSILSPFDNNIYDSSTYLTNAISKKGLIWSTIQGYKGLENSYIIISGFEELNSEQALRLMYVAISRTKFKLFLILSKSIEDQYKKQLAKNIHKLLPSWT